MLGSVDGVMMTMAGDIGAIGAVTSTSISSAAGLNTPLGINSNGHQLPAALPPLPPLPNLSVAQQVDKLAQRSSPDWKAIII